MRYKYPPLLQHSYRANNMVNRVVLDDMAGETVLNILKNGYIDRKYDKKSDWKNKV